jgi:hypothetical protein
MSCRRTSHIHAQTPGTSYENQKRKNTAALKNRKAFESLELKNNEGSLKVKRGLKKATASTCG